MRENIIARFCVCAFIGCITGWGGGAYYSYLHPMKDIEGYWEIKHVLNTLKGKYHIFSRVSIMSRDINSSADVYDSNSRLVARRHILFSVVDIKKNIFVGKVLSMSIINANDQRLNYSLNTPYDVSYPIFYRLNANTLFLQQSLGHPVDSPRLLTRVGT
ncbi:hypothetical protein [Yersinia aldovae]|uniref:Lipoprotein n=2 Tax=Yersinia aldovae TaxID=29483 RepID=A0ABP1YS25_YERAL|nr:hypothetical protein [Yersinia aldovae]CNK04416.1 Uncharacterised protein [Yersinia aldovae]CNL21918.1 Uncharacterised protein [Yersinia aldovae]